MSISNRLCRQTVAEAGRLQHLRRQPVASRPTWMYQETISAADVARSLRVTNVVDWDCMASFSELYGGTAAASLPPFWRTCPYGS